MPNLGENKVLNTRLGKHISGQLIRSSTSVAANCKVASHGQSKQAFIATITIVIGEADDSAFWTEFSIDEGLIKQEVTAGLLNEARELVSIFGRSRKTARGE